MFADTVLSATSDFSPVVDALRALEPRIRASQRFVLGRDVVEAAYNVSQVMPSSVISALNLCRSPFRNTWIEYAGADKPGLADPGTRVPARVGLLIEATSDACDQLLVFPLWQHVSASSIEVGTVAMVLDFSPDKSLSNVDLLADQKQGMSAASLVAEYNSRGDERSKWIISSKDEIEAQLELDGRIYLVPSPAFAPIGDALVRRGGPGVAKELLEAGEQDARSELGLLVATLLLLNSRNGVERSKAKLEKLNKRRKKRSQLPLLDHWTLTMRLGKARRFDGSRRLSDRETRAHLVRGHFKVRASGVYWWSPHVRGNKALGFVSKDYAVKN